MITILWEEIRDTPLSHLETVETNVIKLFLHVGFLIRALMLNSIYVK